MDTTWISGGLTVSVSVFTPPPPPPPGAQIHMRAKRWLCVCVSLCMRDQERRIFEFTGGLAR